MRDLRLKEAKSSVQLIKGQRQGQNLGLLTPNSMVY